MYEEEKGQRQESHKRWPMGRGFLWRPPPFSLPFHSCILSLPSGWGVGQVLECPKNESEEVKVFFSFSFLFPGVSFLFLREPPSVFSWLTFLVFYSNHWSFIFSFNGWVRRRLTLKEKQTAAIPKRKDTMNRTALLSPSSVSFLFLVRLLSHHPLRTNEKKDKETDREKQSAAMVGRRRQPWPWRAGGGRLTNGWSLLPSIFF